MAKTAKNPPAEVPNEAQIMIRVPLDVKRKLRYAAIENDTNMSTVACAYLEAGLKNGSVKITKRKGKVASNADLETDEVDEDEE